MLFLGFLKFLKREKKEPDLDLEKMGDLDVPPPHPGLGEKGLKELPDFPELPELPEKPAPEMGEKSLSEIKFPKEELPKLELPKEKPLPELPGLNMPGVPKFPELSGDIESKQPQLLKPEPSVEFPKPIENMGMPQPSQSPEPISSAPKPPFMQPKAEVSEPAPKIKPYERFERAAVREEKGVLRHKGVQEPIYIRVDRFKSILTGANMIKSNLKIINQSIASLNEIDENKDAVLERWHNVMVDLQKKLIFIDKTLFRR